MFNIYFSTFIYRINIIINDAFHAWSRRYQPVEAPGLTKMGAVRYRVMYFILCVTLCFNRSCFVCPCRDLWYIFSNCYFISIFKDHPTCPLDSGKLRHWHFTWQLGKFFNKCNERHRIKSALQKLYPYHWFMYSMYSLFTWNFNRSSGVSPFPRWVWDYNCMTGVIVIIDVDRYNLFFIWFSLCFYSWQYR